MEIRDYITALLDYFDLLFIVSSIILFFGISSRIFKSFYDSVSFDSKDIKDEDIKDKKSFNPYYDI